jgi:hypothetical protein
MMIAAPRRKTSAPIASYIVGAKAESHPVLLSCDGTTGAKGRPPALSMVLGYGDMDHPLTAEEVRRVAKLLKKALLGKLGPGQVKWALVVHDEPVEKFGLGGVP